MKPRERRETGEMDLFRSRLDQIINMNHELVQLAKTVSWEAIEARCGEVYSDGPGMPPLPTRLMAGLAIFPVIFANGMNPGEGPGLIFMSLPLAFQAMPLGTLFGILFFLMLSMAAQIGRAHV